MRTADVEGDEGGEQLAVEMHPHSPDTYQLSETVKCADILYSYHNIILFVTHADSKWMFTQESLCCHPGTKCPLPNKLPHKDFPSKSYNLYDWPKSTHGKNKVSLPIFIKNILLKPSNGWDYSRPKPGT